MNNRVVVGGILTLVIAAALLVRGERVADDAGGAAKESPTLADNPSSARGASAGVSRSVSAPVPERFAMLERPAPAAPGFADSTAPAASLSARAPTGHSRTPQSERAARVAPGLADPAAPPLPPSPPSARAPASPSRVPQPGPVEGTIIANGEVIDIRQWEMPQTPPNPAQERAELLNSLRSTQQHQRMLEVEREESLRQFVELGGEVDADGRLTFTPSSGTPDDDLSELTRLQAHIPELDGWIQMKQDQIAETQTRLESPPR